MDSGHRSRTTVAFALSAAMLIVDGAIAFAARPILLKDINATGAGGPYDLVRVGDVVYFGANKTGTDDTYYELWRSDGTPTGTRRVEHTGYTDAQDLTRVGSRLFFEAFEDGMDYELWVSNGTKAGTHVVEDIDPTGDSSIGELTAIGNTLFFHADDGTHGVELWRSDGTAIGTKQVRNIAPGAASSSPSQLRSVSGTLYFSANDGTHGREPWTSDGTKAGTRLLKDIHPTGDSDPTDFVRLGNKTLFAATGPGGRELWIDRRDTQRDASGRGHPPLRRREPDRADALQRSGVLQRDRWHERSRAVAVRRHGSGDLHGRGHLRLCEPGHGPLWARQLDAPRDDGHGWLPLLLREHERLQLRSVDDQRHAHGHAARQGGRQRDGFSERIDQAGNAALLHGVRGWV